MVPDELCRGRTDGVRCELENGTGICAREQCRFLACTSGFDDCDDEPGCETDLSSEETCGACGVVCEEDEACQRSGTGYTCGRGIICPTDAFDLDALASNGCEVEATWEDPVTLVPGDLSIEAVMPDEEGLLLAGTTDGGARRVTTSSPPDPRVWSLAPTAVSRAVAVDRHEGALRVLWEDGLSIRTSEGSELFLTPPCEPDIAPRFFVGLAGDVVATSHELFRLDEGVLKPAFGWGDYLAAFWGDFDAAEIESCSPCHFDPSTGEPLAQTECVGTRQCRASDFIPEACGECGPLPASCPDLRFVGFERVGNHLIAATARGVVVFDEDLSPLARVEAPFRPRDGAGGPRFVGMDAMTAAETNGARVELFHSTGMVRGLLVGDDGVEPAHPDLGTGIDLEANPVGAATAFLAVVEDPHVRLIGLSPDGGRSAWLTYESAPGLQGLRPVAVARDADDLLVYYTAAGQVFARRLTIR